MLKCIAICLITLIAACFTCSSLHVSTLHPLLAHHHHLCYVMSIVFFIIFSFSTLLLYGCFFACVNDDNKTQTVAHCLWVEEKFSPTEQGEKHVLCKGYLCTVDSEIVGSISFSINIHCVDGNMAKEKHLVFPSLMKSSSLSIEVSWLQCVMK